MTKFAILGNPGDQRRVLWIGAAVLLALTMAMFGDVLFANRSVVLSSAQCDLASQFIYWREFSADQLRHGHVPLWNPHVFCGTPFLGWAQAGVFYPPNWLDLILPLTLSINLGIALHVFLAGLFTFLWALRRGLHVFAAIFSGVLFMFCGSYFPHVYAGHLSLLCATAWLPLILMSVDQWIYSRAKLWLFVGIVAIAMQVMSGDLQVLFYTGVAALLWIIFALPRTSRWPLKLVGVASMYVVAAGLGAVQLLTSLHAISESVRSRGVSYEFASHLSFPAENFLTLLAPGFYGGAREVSYWGRGYWWEMCLFMGVTGLALAIYGALRGGGDCRRVLLPVLAILLLLALGSNTPVFRFLYLWVPGFDRFRSAAKFNMQASLIFALLAGTGFGALLGKTNLACGFGKALMIAGGIVAGLAFQLHVVTHNPLPTNWWSQGMQTMYQTHQTYLPESDYTDPQFVYRAGRVAANGLLIATIELFLLGGLVLLSIAVPRAVWAIGLMGIAEVFIFGRESRATFDLKSTEAPRLKAFLEQRAGDYRIYYEAMPNIAMWLEREDVWGYAPLVLKRYAEFMAFTQRQSPSEATQYLDFSQFHPVHAMLRWRYAFLPTEKGDRVLKAPSVLPRLQLIHEYRVLKDRDEILQFMVSPAFDPARQMILEAEPDPVPTNSTAAESVKLDKLTADAMTIVAEVSQPAILLITDAYSSGWRATPLEGSVQRNYEVLPANYVLRGIPLSRGHHHLRLEYVPRAFQAGLWISIASVIGFGVWIALTIKKRRLFAT